MEHLDGLSLRRRLQTVSGLPMRLEDAGGHGRAWELDFALIRQNGPGRASQTAQIVDFDLEEGEGFGEESAALYDPRSGYMALQYNHFGPRLARIQAYLNRFASDLEQRPGDDANCGFDLNPVLTSEAAGQLDRVGLVKSVDATVHVPRAQARPDARRRSLSSLLDMPLLGDAETVHIHVSAGRARSSSLALNQVKRTIGELLRMREAVSTLSIVAKEHEDAPREAIDFLDARLETDSALPAVERGRRYPLRMRIASLRQAMDQWRAEGYFDD